MKKIIIIILTLLLLILVIIKLNENSLLLWNANFLKVETSNSLSNNRIKIYQDNHLIYNGKNIQEIKNYYGENDFTILYDNKYKLKFRHFKTNRRHQHTYKIFFFEAKKNIYVDIKINGIDDMQIEERLQKALQ